MINKTLGYILALIGLIGLSGSLIPELGILPDLFSGTIPTLISIAITVIGLIFIMKGSSRKREVARKIC